MSTTHKNRLAGRLPKIGIRPIIDGRRRGVRESQETQTLALAKAVATLLSSKLRHSNGSAVECVLAETCIGGVTEAARCADKFAQEGVGVSISVTPCWCYGAETMDMDPCIPKAVWGFNGTERPGAVYLAAVMAAHNQKGLPAFSIYGRDVQDAGDNNIPADVTEKLIQFSKAALVIATIRGKSYLSMGGVSMGIAASIVDQSFFESYLGMRVEVIDMSEFTRRTEEKIYDEEEFKHAIKWVKENCKEGTDYNPKETQRTRQQKDQDWEYVVKMTLITKDLMVGNEKLTKAYGEEALGHNAIVAGFQGQRQWTDHAPNGDFLEAICNSSFDWEGIREPYIVATENDSLNGTCMLLGHLLTNGAQIFADVRTYWSPESVKRVTGHILEGNGQHGILHLINSGSAALDGTGQCSYDGKTPVMKPFWDITTEEAQKCLKATTWYTSMLEYFRGGGYSSGYRTKGGMLATMFRINIIKGLGPSMQIAEGYAVDLPDKAASVLEERTNITWPSTWFAPRIEPNTTYTTGNPFKDVYSVMYNWGANHCVLAYGHVGHELITLASMLRIPVCMHNVPESRIFRPSTWTAFGAQDLQGADFRACKNFGPLYNKYN